MPRSVFFLPCIPCVPWTSSCRPIPFHDGFRALRNQKENRELRTVRKIKTQRPQRSRRREECLRSQRPLRFSFPFVPFVDSPRNAQKTRKGKIFAGQQDSEGLQCREMPSDVLCSSLHCNPSNSCHREKIFLARRWTIGSSPFFQGDKGMRGI